MQFSIYFFSISDKSGDVFQFVIESEEKEGKCILGHLSMLLDIRLSKCGKFIITCDRDEKIRVSHFPNAYNIHNFCLGHSDFVTCLDMFNDGKGTKDKVEPYPPS